MRIARIIAASAMGAAAGIMGVQARRKYLRDMNSCRLRNQGTSQLLDGDGFTLEYACAGSGQPVLIAHGAPGGFDQGLFMSRLLGERFQWIAVSRFGYLRSSLPDQASAGDQADAYAALLDALDIERTGVVGLSAGAASALVFAQKYPERTAALVLVSAVTGAYPIQIPLLELSLKVAFRSDFADWLLVQATRPAIHHFLGIKGDVRAGLTPAEKAWLSDFIDTFLPLRWHRKGLLHDKSTLPQLGTLQLERIQAPALILHAADDQAVPTRYAERAADKMPDAELLLFKSGGHLLLGHHDQAKTETMHFLARHLG